MHTRLRRLAQPAFSPRQTAGYRPRIEAAVGRLLDRAAAQRSFDLVGALAAPLPIEVITNLLGIPGPDAERFARYGSVIGSALDGIRSLSHAARLQQADAELTELFTDLFALRRREPADDIVTHLVAAEGDRIQPAEMLPMCIPLLVAGFETTVNLIGNAVNALLDHPEQWEALRADPPAMAARAVEETRGPSRLLQRHPLLHWPAPRPPGGHDRPADPRRARPRAAPRRPDQAPQLQHHPRPGAPPGQCRMTGSFRVRRRSVLPTPT